MVKLKLKQSNKELPTKPPIFSATNLQHHTDWYQHPTPNHSIDSSKSILSASLPCFPIKKIQVLLSSDYVSNQNRHPFNTLQKKTFFNALTNQQRVWKEERMKQWYPLYPKIDNNKHSLEPYSSSFSVTLTPSPPNLSLKSHHTKIVKTSPNTYPWLQQLTPHSQS